MTASPTPIEPSAKPTSEHKDAAWIFREQFEDSLGGPMFAHTDEEQLERITVAFHDALAALLCARESELVRERDEAWAAVDSEMRKTIRAHADLHKMTTDRDALAARVGALREALEHLQWHHRDSQGRDHCPSCANLKEFGHMPTCLVGRALAATAESGRMRDERIGAEGWNAALEAAADIHPNIRVTCDHEEAHGSPGCACMGTVIHYRDSIRELKKP